MSVPSVALDIHCNESPAGSFRKGYGYSDTSCMQQDIAMSAHLLQLPMLQCPCRHSPLQNSDWELVSRLNTAAIQLVVGHPELSMTA